LGAIGGVKPSIRLRVAGSNGFCGEISGAHSAAAKITSVTTAAATVRGERMKL